MREPRWKSGRESVGEWHFGLWITPRFVSLRLGKRWVIYRRSDAY